MEPIATFTHSDPNFVQRSCVFGHKFFDLHFIPQNNKLQVRLRRPSKGDIKAQG